jgi:hypothetical protein
LHPLRPHIVIGYHPRCAELREHAWPGLDLVHEVIAIAAIYPVEKYSELFEALPVIGISQIENTSPVNRICREQRPPAFGINQDGRVAYG